MELKYEEEVSPLKFLDIARLPKPTDNVAVAIDVIPEGTAVELLDGNVVRISHTVLEGHRFAVKKIHKDEGLFSWNMQFGTALKDIYPGEYIMNERGLKALKVVDPTFKWPDQANFDDRIIPYDLEEKDFVPAPPMELIPNYQEETFMGYKRSGNRGVGTRNYVVVFSASSLCSNDSFTHYYSIDGLVKKVTEDSQSLYLPSMKENCDGIVCCLHTEGSIDQPANNFQKYLRTISGFLVHPNVGAGIVVYNEEDPLQQATVRQYIQDHYMNYDDLSLQWISLQSLQFSTTPLQQAIQSALSITLQATRSSQPVSTLCLALQCGGSDAFSGVTANPLQGAVAEYFIHRAASAILAETDELIGADSYILHKVASYDVVRAFQQTQAHYEQEANLHGVSAQANPSGGNFYRGLYNIALKSLGAAMKKSENSRLEGVLKYGERIQEGNRGYFFMDTPGNDIESVTGQVAGGCTIIMFSTVKLLTTSKRYHRLENDLDINAGEYLEGKSLETLTAETVAYVKKIAEGQRTFGEKAHHSQIQIWRNWYCQCKEDFVKLNSSIHLHAPYQPTIAISSPSYSYTALHYQRSLGITTEDIYTPRVGTVVFPTSLCSGQIARIISEKVPALPSSFITALVHTEGCAEGYGLSEQDGIRNYDRIAVGHLIHPFTRLGYLIEHGCEKTLLTYFDQLFNKQYHIDMNIFGQGSVQKEGGIENAVNHASQWLIEKGSSLSQPEVIPNTPLTKLIFGIMSSEKQLSSSMIQFYISLCSTLLNNHCIVVLPENDPLLTHSTFCETFFSTDKVLPSLLNGQPISSSSSSSQGILHVMKMRSPYDYTETVTSLAATGASCILHYSNIPIVYAGHPFVPVFRISEREGVNADGFVNEGVDKVMKRIIRVLSREDETICMKCKYSDFQILRTAAGYSL